MDLRSHAAIAKPYGTKTHTIDTERIVPHAQTYVPIVCKQEYQGDNTIPEDCVVETAPKMDYDLFCSQDYVDKLFQAKVIRSFLFLFSSLFFSIFSDED